MVIFAVFSKLFYEMDLFKTPVYLFVNSRSKTSTKFGSFLSCLIYAFIFYSFLFSNMYLRINPAVIDQLGQQHHRNAMYFDNSNFSLAMSLNNEDGINFIDPTMFTFHLRLRTLQSFEGVQGYVETIYDDKTMHPCSPEDFPGNPHMFKDLSLKNALCLDNSSLKLEGYWDESRLTYIKIWLNFCINDTKSSIVCKPHKDIVEFLKGKYFGIYYQDFSFDLKNYSDPVKKNFKYDYQLVTPQMRKEVSLFIKETELLNDDNYLFNDDHVLQYYQKDFLTLDFEEIKEDGMLNTILIYASNIKQSSSRKYQKFAEVLASLGGTAKALTIIGFLIVKNQASLNLMRIIMSKLYDFPKSGEGDRTESTLKSTVKSHFSKADPKSQSSINPFSKKPKKSKAFILNKPLNESIVNTKTRKRVIFKEKAKIQQMKIISLWSAFKTFIKYLFGWKSMSRTERLYLRANELYSKTLDICDLMKKIQEIDKLKAVLLNSRQKSLFNLMAKPLLVENTKNMENVDRRGEILSQTIHPDIEQDKVVVKKVLDEHNQDKEISEIDSRLLKLLESQYIENKKANLKIPNIPMHTKKIFMFKS